MAQEELAWWKQQLSGAPALLDLPTDRPRPTVFSSAGAEVPVHLDATTGAAIRAVAAAHRTTPFVVLLTGLQVRGNSTSAGSVEASARLF